MAKCMKCGRENDFIAFMGKCGPCQEQERQTAYLRQQACQLQEQSYQQERQAQAQAEAQQAVVQSRCKHEYVATAVYKPSYSTKFSEATPVDLGHIKAFQEDHSWTGKCRYCGILMSKFELDTCHHHWAEDYYFGRPAGQCCHCGALKPEVEHNRNTIIAALNKQAQEKQKKSDSLKMAGYIAVTVIACFIWFSIKMSGCEVQWDDYTKVENFEVMLNEEGVGARVFGTVYNNKTKPVSCSVHVEFTDDYDIVKDVKEAWIEVEGKATVPFEVTSTMSGIKSASCGIRNCRVK